MTTARPDHGYSWVIMFSCAYIHFALFGVFRSWGIIYVAVLKDYGVTREEASWPFSLCSAVFQLVGPVVSVITHYTSRRLTCLLGSVVATLGVVCCYFAPSALWLTIFYGVIHGLGFGIIVTLIPVFLNLYFVKHRATALGIAFSGGAVGSLVVPIAMEWLLETYNLSGSFLILGGLVMNNLVAAALLRPPPWIKKAKNQPNVPEAKNSLASTPTNVSSIAKVIEPYSRAESGFNDSASVEYDSPSEKKEQTSTQESSQLKSFSTDTASEVHDSLLSNCDSFLFDSSHAPKTYIVSTTKDNTPEMDCEIKEPLMNGKHATVIQKMDVKKQNKLQKAAVAILEILKQPRFYLITFTMFIYFFCLQCFLVVIVDYTTDKHIEEDSAKYIVSIFSLADVLGRCGLGWVTDRNYVKRNKMIIFNLIVIGISMQLYPLINDLTGLLILAAFHGIPVGSSISLFFVLQAEYLGMKRLTLVLGLTGFINGFLTLLRPAVIGFFRDTIGAYDWMFHSMGMLCYALSIVWLAESQTHRNKKSASFEKA